MLVRLSSFLVAVAIPVSSRPWYADQIPNGRRVPHPGPQGGVWAGVGHLNSAGGGPRNPFGQDFEAANFQWTKQLCEMDSDGDGAPNGVELGDPNCVWVMGDEPEGPAISHPGIPDAPTPPGDGNEGTDPCDNFEAPRNMKTLDIKFTNQNRMDASRTHYICEQKRISAPARSRSYHQIKTEALIDNSNVVHHMWIYQCPAGTTSTDGNKVDQGSYDCNGMEGNCQIVAGWAVGASDFCEPANVGAFLDFGAEKESVFKIEVHYDNAVGRPQKDQSGMRLSMTRSFRPLNSGITILGMSYWDREFVLPAGKRKAKLTNICPSTATERLPHPIWVYSFNPHMHLYGKKLVTEHYRCGEKIGELGRIDDYDFNNQQSYYFDKPIKVLPGDALVTKCVYDTRGVSNAISGGESTEEEMCDNYLTYYPYAGSNSEPNLFSACWTLNTGASPDFIGFNDFTPFGAVDLGWESVFYRWQPEPRRNFGSCCGTPASCELAYLSPLGFACAEDFDCQGGGVSTICSEGLCVSK